MDQFSKLKRHLVATGILSEEQLLRAEDYALTMNISLDEAIVFLKLLDHQQLGQCLSQLYGKPYVPLLDGELSHDAKAKVPVKIAERLNIFPVKYDLPRNKLTLAIHDPEDEALNEKLGNLFPPPLKVETTIASRSEILTAIDVHYKGRPYKADLEVELPEEFTIISGERPRAEELDLEDEAHGKNILLLEPDLDRSRALMGLLRKEGFQKIKWAASPQDVIDALKEQSYDLLLVNGLQFRPEGAWLNKIQRETSTPQVSYYDLKATLLGQEYPYAQMSEALISSLSFIIKRALRKDPETLKQVATRVRYCKLLGLRLGLTPVQLDSVTLAAWLVGNPMGELLLNNIETPYHLGEISKQRHEQGQGNRIEARVLGIVMRYQALKRQMPEQAKDMAKVRKALSKGVPAGHAETLIEEFLHVIRDEEFLREVEKEAGRILVVDPEFSPDSNLGLRLVNEGYHVQGAKDARSAADIIMKSGVDVILSEVSLPEIDGIRFCRALRKKYGGEDLTFFFFTSEQGEGLAAKCLEAGADDFLEKSADLDLVCLKIKRIMEMKGHKKSKRGVSGSLTDMSAMDIIQSVATGDKDVVIIFESNGKRGKIYIQGGDIIHAEIDGQDGEEAFYRLMAFQQGNFEILPCSSFPLRTVHGNTMSLLMEGARLVDEMAEDE